MGRNVLVVSTVDHAEDVLRRRLGGDVDELKVVVPVVQQGFLDWLANDEQAASQAGEDAARSPSFRFQRTRPVSRAIEYSAPLFLSRYSERPHRTGGNSSRMLPVIAHCSTNGGRSPASSGRNFVRAFVKP